MIRSMTIANGANDWMCRLAGAIAEPARARMLYCLMDNRARTSTELAVVADISASTASAHLNRLKEERLVTMKAQGKHRYYALHGVEVADLLETLSTFAGKSRNTFAPRVPQEFISARSCYDHIAGRLGVALHDRLLAMEWFSVAASCENDAYELTSLGAKMLNRLGVDLEATRGTRRRFAYGCLDWSERRPHIGGAVGAALLKYGISNGWVNRDLNSRALFITRRGRRELLAHFGIVL